MTTFKISFLLLLFISTIGCKDNRVAENTAITPQKLSDEELMDIVQRQTLKYFWDFAEPNSGMARERFHPDGNYPKNDANVVTTGGSGFGLMAIVAGMEREFIPRDSAVARLDKIADFLADADRYHGAWAHWIYGDTGKTRAFSKRD